MTRLTILQSKDVYKYFNFKMLAPKPKPSPLTMLPDKAGDAVGALCGGGCSCPKWAGTVDDN